MLDQRTATWKQGFHETKCQTSLRHSRKHAACPGGWHAAPVSAGPLGSAASKGSGVVASRGVALADGGPGGCCWRSIARAGSGSAASVAAAVARPAAGLAARAVYSSCVARTTAAARSHSQDLEPEAVNHAIN